MESAPPPRTQQDGALFMTGGVALCFAIIVYSSLVPFTGWRFPDEIAWNGIARRHQTGFDLLLNVLVYVAPGYLLARLGSANRVARPLLMTALLCSGLSLLLESMQLFVPGRVAALHDWLANSAGAFFGAMAALSRTGDRAARHVIGWRRRWLDPEKHAEIGALLLLCWLIAQTNPAVPYFEAGNIVNRLTTDWQADPYEPLFLVPQVVAIGLNVCGFALFISVFAAPRHFAGVPVTLILVAGLLIKFLAAGLMLKAPLLGTWLGPTSVLGLLAGYVLALLLLGTSERSRLFLALVLVFAGGLMAKMAGFYEGAQAMLGVFDWPHGQIGAFAKLTRWLNELWPIAALIYLAWLFVTTRRSEVAAQVE
jgi:VanZ family protein